eukprot:SAG31_NODE_4415_length_3229_cov_11.320330_1_plen_201_part_00
MLVVISKVLLSILVLVPILFQFYLHGATVPLNLAGCGTQVLVFSSTVAPHRQRSLVQLHSISTGTFEYRAKFSCHDFNYIQKWYHGTVLFHNQLLQHFKFGTGTHLSEPARQGVQNALRNIVAIRQCDRGWRGGAVCLVRLGRRLLLFANRRSISEIFRDQHPGALLSGQCSAFRLEHGPVSELRLKLVFHPILIYHFIV